MLLSVHNGAEHLAASINSVLEQTFEGFELLVIDDGSTDGTADIIRDFSDGRIRCIHHSTNRGLIASLNEGLEAAHGQHVARMDADDICHPRRLEMQHGFLEAHPDVGVVGSGVRFIDQNGRPGPVYQFPEEHDLILWALAFICPMVHPSVMMRRDLVLSAGGYTTTAVHAEDYDLWCRLSTRTRLANLPQVLLNLRKGDFNVTAREAKWHATTATEISARCISGRIGRPVSEAVAACLMGIGVCSGEIIPEAARVLLELYKSFEVESEGARAVVRRDTAMRLAMLALRGTSGLLQLRLAWRATQIDPRGWTGLGRRVVRRFTGWGVQRLVG